MAIKFSRTPFTPLYGDVLRYLDRRGLPSVSNIFGDYKGATNPYLIDFDEEETTTKPIDQIRMPAAPLNQRRDSGGGPSPRGIGSFGNLDPNSVKYFNLNGKIVKGYRNLSSGLYQTEEGKNIIGAEEAGISAAGAFPGQGYIPGHPFSKGYQGLALKAAEDARKAAQIKAAEEAAAAAREQAAAEAAKREAERRLKQQMESQNISRQEAQRQNEAIRRDQQRDRQRDRASQEKNNTGYDRGNYCFDPNTLIQMADGSEKKIKEIQLGDQTKGGEVTGVFQFKASDEIHDYKGVTVAGSHYVKEDGKFIMVKDSPISVKIDKIPVVYSLDTTGRRIFINNIEFADYNGDGIAKGFLANAGVDLTGFDKEVLRQVENRLI